MNQCFLPSAFLKSSVTLSLFAPLKLSTIVIYPPFNWMRTKVGIAETLKNCDRSGAWSTSTLTNPTLWAYDCSCTWGATNLHGPHQVA